MPAQTTCTRCHRPLRSPKSVARGFGESCWRRIQAAAKVTPITGYKPKQIKRAADLLTSGGVQRDGTMYLTLSSDKATRYRTNSTAQTCTCKAGQYGRRCSHQLAVAVLAAA